MSDNKISILIVEDDPVIAADLTYIMQDLGYSPFPPMRNAADVLLMLKNTRPDCIIVDVNLEGKKDGIELASEIKSEYGIPVIFLTAHHDRNTIERIKKIQPSAYLVKPIEVHTLQTTIELALYNASHSDMGAKEKEQENENEEYISDKYFFIKVKNQLKKVSLDEIVYLEAYDNYSYLHTPDQKYIISSNLKSIENKLSDHQFVRVHRSYLINLNFVDGIEDDVILINKVKIPIGKTYKDDFMKFIDLL
jgi:two-component system, LytTR family, response regulator LytT